MQTDIYRENYTKKNIRKAKQREQYTEKLIQINKLNDIPDRTQIENYINEIIQRDIRKRKHREIYMGKYKKEDIWGGTFE